MKNSKLIIMMALLFIGSSTVFAQTQEKGAMQRTTTHHAPAQLRSNSSAQRQQGYIEALKDSLKLSDAQVTKIKTIRDENRQKLMELRKEATVIRKNEKSQILQVLTPEQQKKLEKMREERKAQTMRKMDERKVSKSRSTVK